MASPATSRLIDFHSHYCDPAWYASPLTQLPAAIAQTWPLLTDIEAQLAVLDTAGIETKVLTAPPSMVATPGQFLPHSLISLCSVIIVTCELAFTIHQWMMRRFHCSASRHCKKVDEVLAAFC